MSWATTAELAELAAALETTGEAVTSTVVDPYPVTPDGAGGYTRPAEPHLLSMDARVERVADPEWAETPGGSRSRRTHYVLAVPVDAPEVVEGARLALASPADVLAAVVALYSGDPAPLLAVPVLRVVEVVHPGRLGIARYLRCERTDTLSGE